MNTDALQAEHAEALAVLENCRRAMITVLRTVKPMGPTYHGASMVMAAIDSFAEILTGNTQHFSASGSVGPGRAEAVRARQREVGGNQEARPARIQSEIP